MISGGNPVGGSFTGPAEALEIVGNFGMAYRGVVECTCRGTTMLSFTTGKFIFNAKIQANYGVNQADDMTYELLFNDKVVQKWFNPGATGVSNASVEPTNPVFLIIPAYTKVEFKCTSAASTRENIASLIGRIHRARD